MAKYNYCAVFSLIMLALSAICIIVLLSKYSGHKLESEHISRCVIAFNILMIMTLATIIRTLKNAIDVSESGILKDIHMKIIYIAMIVLVLSEYVFSVIIFTLQCYYYNDMCYNTNALYIIVLILSHAGFAILALGILSMILYIISLLFLRELIEWIKNRNTEKDKSNIIV